MNTDIDTFFKELPKEADVKAEIATCHEAIKTFNAGIVSQRVKIKRLRRLLALAEAEAGKVVKRGPRKKKTQPSEGGTSLLDHTLREIERSAADRSSVES